MAGAPERSGKNPGENCPVESSCCCCAPCAGAREVEKPSGGCGCWRFLDGDKEVAFLKPGVAWEGGGVTCGCAAVAQKVCLSLQTCACCEQDLGALIPAKPGAELCSSSSAWCKLGVCVALPFPLPDLSALLAFRHLVPFLPGATLSCGDAFLSSLGCWKYS